MITLTIPLKTTNPLNCRRHWRVVYAQGQKDKATTRYHLRAATGRTEQMLTGPTLVTITRVSYGKGLDKHDALPAAMKHVVDMVAAFLCVDDADPRLEIRYLNKRSHTRGEHLVLVTIEAKGLVAA